MSIDRVSNTQGNGDPNCPDCRGRGHVSTGTVNMSGIAKFEICKCVEKKERWRNVERIRPGLRKAAKVSSSPLLDQVDTNTLITANESVFHAHLKHVALRQRSTWFCRIESDLDLARAWLANVELEGGAIYDADVAGAKATLRYVHLEDLARPPDLLIIRLGVKSSPNKSMPEVLLEVLQLRTYLDKPTWLYDQPHKRFTSGHICYSTQVRNFVSDWDRLEFSVSGYKASEPEDDEVPDESGMSDVTMPPSKSQSKPKTQRTTKVEARNPGIPRQGAMYMPPKK